MPVWLTLILGFLSALPDLIKLIASIFTKSKQLPDDEGSAVRAELKELAYRAVRTKAKDHRPLRDLLARIEARLKPKP